MVYQKNNNFIEEVKAAINGVWPRRKPKKKHKTPEEIYKEVMKLK